VVKTGVVFLMEIREETIKRCPECSGPFFHEERCAFCGSDKERIVFWVSKDNNCLFKLISDTRDV
jgi:hypothetical protein